MRQDPPSIARGSGVAPPRRPGLPGAGGAAAAGDDERPGSRDLAEPGECTHTSPPPLRGREAQTRLIGRALDRARNARRATQGWIGGPGGIGKSRLLLEAERMAAARGFTVVRLRSDEFSPVGSPGSLLEALSEPSAPDAPREGRGDEQQVRIGWSGLLRNHPRQAPLLISCDEGRLAAALPALPARLRDHPLVWLATRRTEYEPGGAAHPAYDPPDVLELPLGPLAEEAVAQMFADCLGGTPDLELRTLLGLAQGNPRRLVAVIHQLRDQGDVRVQDNIARVVTRAAAGASSGPVPAWLRGLLAERLATLSPQTRLLMEVATVLGPSCLPEDIAEMLGEPVGALLPRFREAITAGLVRRDTETVTFRHDLMRQALVDDMPGVVRGAMHRQALGMLIERGRSPASVATHLIHGAHRGDPTIASLLCRAAEESVLHTPGTAAELALRGLELVRPVVDEAHEPLTVVAVEACVRSGRLPPAVVLAEEALTRTAGPETTARLRYWLSTALLLLGRTSGSLAIAEALVADPDSPAQLRRRAELNRLSAWSVRDGPQGTRHARRALREVGERDRDGEPDIRAGITTSLAVMRWRAGHLDEALALCRKAVELADGGSVVEWHTDPRPIQAAILAHVGRFGEAETTLGPVPRSVGFVADAVPGLVRARVALADGRLDDARREAAAGLAVAERSGARVLMPAAWMVLATVARHRGETADVGDYAGRLRDALPDDRGRVYTAAAAWFEAQSAVAGGDPPGVERAVEELWANEAGRRGLAIEEPDFAPWLVRLLLARGDRARAVVVGEAAERLAHLSPGLPVVRAAAEHARGLLTGDAEALEAAAGSHRDAWARASAAEDLGALLVNANRARAVRTLEGALALYRQVGAEGDAARVRRRLRAIGVRRRHWTHADQPGTGWASLTHTERTVAEHVLQGLTNRQVAGRMFLSPHTVAFHLRQIFRKLGVHSRLELARFARDVGPGPGAGDG
ncbi:LuxR C-terminal-related transcriptional regulator [Embleya sp. AB8]|uniref:helix-turn-helix transcriptional regulator n=1 Tax=Embleya sp. AB8 TaxID=3156304 RepID=UPI003C74A837